MPKRRWDAGHASTAEALSLLELAGEVLVPETALDELERGPSDVSGQELWIAR